MMLDIDELEELLDDLRIRILEANRRGTLEKLLQSLGMQDLLKPTPLFESYHDGKIVVIGGSDVKEEILCGIAGSIGIDKNRFEFCLNFCDTQKYNYKKFQYAPQYRVVLFGPVPHSTTGKGDSTSVITEMENGEAYPRIERLMSNGVLKITKSNFKAVLEKLQSESYI